MTIKERNRLGILLASTLIFLVVVVCLFGYLKHQETILSEGEKQAFQQLNHIKELLDVYGQKRNQLINNYLRNIRQILEKRGQITENKDVLLQIEIKKQITQEVINEEVPQWKIGNEQLQYNLDLFDEILAKTTCPAALYQKTDKGYLRVGVTQNELINAVAGYYFIPNGEEVVSVVESGSIYTSRTMVGAKEFLAIHQPLQVEGKIKGMLVISVREDYLKVIPTLKVKENQKATTFLYAINKTGTIAVHPKSVGLNLRTAEPEFWKYLKKNKEKLQNAPQAYFLEGKFKSTWQYVFYDYHTENYWLIEADYTEQQTQNFYHWISLGFAGIVASIVFVVLFLGLYWLKYRSKEKEVAD
ncbi:MAG: Cache 3/Cache 2 fusion domain-containing protein [Microscillaceae bacterium]|nr:Cache 3/Cache 2 fusion domain-containing protein [Microscillaceae bacterium]MDW8460352.1 Cache 3/Cache 2 fusion domain-containing protein [Cytophagales bacterium]